MQTFLRGIFSELNTLIYSFIETLYNFLMTLADVRVFSLDTLKTFSTRIYAILGIFMAFKLTFTFITYAVNPEKMTDKSTGGKKLVINIIGSLILLIAVPNLIFPLSRELQTAMLTDHILEQVILGIDPVVGTSAVDTRRAGRYLSFSILNGFFFPDPALSDGNADGAKTCENASLILDTTIENQDPASQTELDKAIYKLNGDCAAAILEQVDDAGDTVFWYETAYTQKSVANLLVKGKDAANLKSVKTKDGEFVFQFNYIISLLVGCIVIFMLINFCFKIAVRTIKLGFLELVAPIPILSFIDPSSKKKSFDGWVKTCISTYLDLFIRLAALYFAIFMITQVTTGANPLTYSDGRPVGGFVTVVIIIGALMFANQIPELIKSILGVDLGKDSFSLNPFKGSPLAAGVLGGALGMAGGGVLGMFNNYQAHQQLGHSKIRSALSGAGGVVTGGVRGLGAGAKNQSFTKGFTGLGGIKSSLGAGAGASSVGGKKIQEKDGTGMIGRNIAKVQNLAHMKTAGDIADAKSKSYQEAASKIKALNDRAKTDLAKHREIMGTGEIKYKDHAGIEQKENVAGQNIAAFREQLERDKKAGTKPIEQIIDDEAKLAMMEKQAYTNLLDSYVNKPSSGQFAGIADAETDVLYGELSEVVAKDKEFYSDIKLDFTSGSGISDSKKAIEAKRAALERSDKTARDRSNRDYAKNVIGPHEHPHGK